MIRWATPAQMAFSQSFGMITESMKSSTNFTPSLRMLIYGFGPYRQFRDNVTEKILRQMPRRRWLRRIVFPVRFHRKQFVAAVEATRPDIILGLGQCSRGRYLRSESQALNRRRNSKKEKARPIVAGGRRRLLTDLRLACGRQGRLSDNAGDFVCNYSMYLILDFLRRRGLSTRYGFVHIPHSYNVKKAARLLTRAIDKIKPKPGKMPLRRGS